MKRVVQLSLEQKKLYEQMKRLALAEMNGKLTTTATALTQLMRLQQITCGHFKADDDSYKKLKIIVLMNLWSLLKKLKVKLLFGLIGVMILPLL